MTKKKNKISIVLSLTFLLAAFYPIINNVYSIDGQPVITEEEADDLNREISSLNADIESEKERIRKIQQKQEEYSVAIKARQAEQDTLANAMEILDNRIAKFQLDVELAKGGIEQTQLEIKKTDIQIANKTEDIEREKGHIANVLKLIQKNDNTTALEILLLNNSLAEFLSQMKYLEDVNKNIKESIDNLEKMKVQLDADKESLKDKNKKQEALKLDLEDKLAKLDAEKDNKVNILIQVKESEKEYQYLLAKAKAEQQSAANEIANKEKEVRSRITKLEQSRKVKLTSNGMQWPVKKNTITAYFHDPDYPFRNIFEHPAIDIRAKQGTVLKAADSGFVAKVKVGENGGYGYIMIVHADGLSTVYGHVSKIMVAEDDFVTQGQQIGLSGGMPGTNGAGRMTTGPHLHFEVRLNGIPVDPLSYLQ